MFRAIGKKAHPLRICPIGSHWVREHPREVDVTVKNPSGITIVDGHCRRNRNNKYKDQLHSLEIIRISDEFKKKKLKIGNSNIPKARPQDVHQFDSLIEGWTNYWNDVFHPAVPLPVDLAKALLGSESTFKLKAADQNAGASEGKARGIMQLTDKTQRILGNEKGELKDHYLFFDKKDVYQPEVSIAAGIRWLFHKKALGDHRLKRDLTWEEGVAYYKGLGGLINNKKYLENKDYREFKNMLDCVRRKK